MEDAVTGALAANSVLAADQDLDLDDEDVRDPETFDDTEFYQQLLKEFLDNQGVAGMLDATGYVY